MKTILILALSFLTLSATAGIGPKSFTHSVSASTEAEVLVKVEAAIPLIVSGKIKSVWQSQCRPTNSRTVKVNGVGIKKSYKVDSYGNLNPWFTGSIRYTHKRCFESNR
jgi:hypothetical protein